LGSNNSHAILCSESSTKREVDDMQLVVERSENGKLTLAIPEELIKGTKLEGQDTVIVYAMNGGLVVQHKNHVKPPTLDELFEGYEGDYEGEEWGTGKPVGDEVF